MKTYLEPLKKETFLSNTEINALFGNIQEIYGFQQQFLQPKCKFQVILENGSDGAVHASTTGFAIIRLHCSLYTPGPGRVGVWKGGSGAAVCDE